MQLARLLSATFFGLDALPVEVEVDVSPSDKLHLLVVGLPDTAVRESKERVLAALKYAGFSPGNVHCTVNLAPGNIKKEGPLYDLPIALGVVIGSKRARVTLPLDQYLIVGELGLGGEIRPVAGVLAIAMLAKSAGKRGVIVPSGNAKEASAVPGIEVIAIAHLKEAVGFLENPTTIAPIVTREFEEVTAPPAVATDFADIKGQAHVKRAMEIAAAGMHNVLLSGPPGSGKTMLARALIGIMPPMTLEEALEATKIHSISGLIPEGHGLVVHRPFRSPHHTISYGGLIGGGTIPRPGEVSLAHNGILFLDELPEFSRATLEVLRQPLQDRQVTISRANGTLTFPTHFMCIAAMNPCPCGHQGNPDKPCRDTQFQIDRYRSRISGPLLDRIDMYIEVPALRYREMTAPPASESSTEVRRRVTTTRYLQRARYGSATKTNATMTPSEVKKHCQIDAASQDLIHYAIDTMGISARAHDGILRVARTIADLDGKDTIERAHLMEAIGYRKLPFGGGEV